MSENTTTTTTKTECPCVVYATKAEAHKAWTPPAPKAGTKKAAEGLDTYKVFDIVQTTPATATTPAVEKVIGYVWGRGYTHALSNWASAAHNVAASYSNGNRPAGVPQQQYDALLAVLTPEQRAAYLASTGQTPAATPPAPAAKPTAPAKGKVK